MNFSNKEKYESTSTKIFANIYISVLEVDQEFNGRDCHWCQGTRTGSNMSTYTYMYGLRRRRQTNYQLFDLNARYVSPFNFIK